MIPWIVYSVALTLLIVEFYIPTGIIAIGSMWMYALSLFLAYSHYSKTALILFFMSTLCIAIGVVILMLFLIKRSDNVLYLNKTQEAYTSYQYDESLIGKTGVCATDLGPSGFIFIEGRRVQGVSDMGYLEKGSQVILSRGQGAYFIVQKIEND